MPIDAAGKRISDHVLSPRPADVPRDGREHVGVVHRPGDVHRTDVDALNERNELRTIPAGDVYEVVHRPDGNGDGDGDGDGNDADVTGPYDGLARASEVALDRAEARDLPIRNTVDRVVPDAETRDRRRRRGRWPPWRDEARAVADALPDDLPVSDGDHDVAVRIGLSPDPDPPDDDADRSAFADRFDVIVAHNVGNAYEVVETVESDVENREEAVDAAIRAAREREWPVFPMITLAPSAR